MQERGRKTAGLVLGGVCSGKSRWAQKLPDDQAPKEAIA
jgi:adenosyl cobinamide kinase/adenosyl cobinamide phosphate guanylyltransferase